MKKLFALFMVVAMLSIAGTAMAADTMLSASRNKLSMKTGSTETVSLTAVAGHSGGTLGDITVSGPAWATVSGRTLTLAPTAAGNYTVTVTVTETYTDSDAVGHAAPRTLTSTASQTIAVTVVAPTAGTTIITRVVEVVTEVTKTVTVISQVARNAAVVQTFTETVRSVTQVITTAVLTTGSAGYSQALAAVWTAKATQVETARAATVNVIATNPQRRAQVFPGLAATAVVTPRSNTSLVSVTSTTTSTMTVTEKLAVMTEALGGAGKALSAQEAVKPSESGTYSFVKTFGKALYGTKIKGHNGKRASVSASGAFSASAVDNSGVAFVNSSGDIVDTIPGDERSQDIMPGYVTMLVVMDAGEVYEPVVYATESDLAANNVAVDTTPTTVTYDEISTKEEKVTVTVKEDGTVEETVISEPDDPEVKAALETKINNVMATALGKTAVAVKSVSAFAGKGVAATTITNEDTLAKALNVFVAARPSITYENLSDDVYYMPVTFKGLPSGSSLASNATFTFYPDGIEDGTKAFAKVFDNEGAEVTIPGLLLLDENGTEAYVAFVIENSGIRTADTNNSLTNPTVTIELASTKPTSPDTKPTSPDTKPTSPDTKPTSPDTPITGVGGSSGGCTAGSAALALAVLGVFIASRKK